MTPQLRIAIDGRSLQREPTGVGTYTSNLLDQFRSLDVDVVLFASQDLPPNPGITAARVRVVKVPDAFHNNFLWTNLALRRQLGRHPHDVFHSPGYTLPLWLRGPSVLSIHDVCYAAHPEWYPYSNGAVRRTWYRLSAQTAGYIVAPSEFSRREIARVYGIPAEKLFVVAMGVDRRRFRKIEQKDLLEDIKRRYGIHNDFLLFVGDVHPRRNVERLIQAFRVIREQEFKDLELVLIGRILDRSRPAVAESVRVLGYVPAEDVPCFYSLAKAFVFPSLYEGFGLGVLEAMACGCPVIVGRGTACEEAAGEAGICVDPTDITCLADAAAGLLKNPEMAAQHAEAGLKRADRFSWRKTAEETVAIYRHIQGKSKRDNHGFRG
jgi:glycosyltransferase involved in cell wall biosynthesis